MKKLYSATLALAFSVVSYAQICNPTGNLILFSNYDGGVLNINLDAPMSNIKIGVCSYEGVTINISGIGASAVTGVAYAGYNASNAHCGSVINTSITGAPGSATTTITLNPPSPLANPNGNGTIDCAYSCSTTTNQGGCNTIDQVEAYFLNFFPGSTIFSHKVQYGCWTATQNVSAGGTCCSVATGITNIEIEGFILSPNPAQNELHIAALNGYNTATFRVFSIDGKLVKGKTALTETIDLSAFETGTYIIELTDGDYVTHKRFVKN
ncbi:MAG: T9SS type A sorting domain-containing protein [Bacteroidia bacterium]